jgi:hypothetical protein
VWVTFLRVAWTWARNDSVSEDGKVTQAGLDRYAWKVDSPMRGQSATNDVAVMLMGMFDRAERGKLTTGSPYGPRGALLTALLPPRRCTWRAIKAGPSRRLIHTD